MENMKRYCVSGELMKGFFGTIAYETILPENTNELNIRVSFQKREMEEVTEMDRQLCKEAWKRNVGEEPDEAVTDGLIQGQKTEINVSVFHNGAYLGCAHRDEINKEIILSPQYASDGFHIWKPQAGVLRVVLLVYQVVNDHTPYEVEVIGKEQEA